MKRIEIYKLLLLTLISIVLASCFNSKSKEKPNIILIYVDDLGYGDVSSYGATSVQTPNVDFLANNGLRFTDAHCTAATCTPSRFSLLTGIYAFRNNAAILPGDAPLLIDTAALTLPKWLQGEGYNTAVVGKWHLGLGRGTIDWNNQITPGPAEVGFNYSYIVPATTDRVPCVYVENGKIVNLDPADPIEVSYKGPFDDSPTGLSNPELLKMDADSQHSNFIINGISRIGFMKGGKSAYWKDEDMADVLTGKAITFIQQNKKKPFFLYFALPDIHVPRAPNERFIGKTTMGRRGDMIAEMDWMVGAIVDEIKKQGLAKNTLIIFTSDNGPVLDDGYMDQAEKLVGSHDPSGGFRGGKYSAYEAGTRMPTITYWPGKINSGVSSAVISQVDFFASLSSLVSKNGIGNLQNDGQNYIDALMGKSDIGRDVLLEESFTFSVRMDNWKYIAPMEKKTPDWLRNKKIETGLSQEDQLYDLAKDPKEQVNMADKYPDIVKKLKGELEKIKITKTVKR